MSKIHEWALAIKEYEGWKPGSRSFRNCNPGNLRYYKQIGSTGKDRNGFAIFPSYEVGINALMRQLVIAANGTSKAYRSTMTLIDFFRVYAPSSDNNEPDRYAQFVANKLQVDPNIQIKNLL